MGEDWTKSSFSKNQGQCVEARLSNRGCDVRDSQHPGLEHLAFPGSAWVHALATIPVPGSSSPRFTR